MWIKLIAPQSTRRPMDSSWKTRMAPPLPLLVLGALTPPEHRVTVADENCERLRLDDTPGLVGITVKVDTAPRAFAIADAYRARGIPVVLGGIHATACPDDCALHADSVVVGEAELLWPRLLRDLAAGGMRRFYRNAGPVPLTASPVPRWELLDERNYLFHNTITISRGCPWRCTFCYNSLPEIDARYRLKSIPQILREIASLGIAHVMFIDDNFAGNPEFLRRLLPELARLNLTWHAAVSADIGGREDLLDAMAASGCKSLFIGFESVNPNNLLACRKRQNRRGDYDATIARIHRRGIMVNASLVFGFDDDDETVFPDTLEWLLRNRLSTMTAHILTPYPGTPFYDQLRAEGRIFDHDLSHYNTAHAVFTPKRMSPEALRAGYLRLYDEFYSWSNILNRWPEAPGQAKAYLAFNLVYRKYGKLTSKLGELVGMRPLAKLARVLAYPPQHRPVPVAPPLPAPSGG